MSCVWGHGGDGTCTRRSSSIRPARTELARAREIGDELFDLVVSLGGSVAGEHGIGWLKRGRLAGQWDERALALHEEIKSAFDPKGLLNPAKKLARAPSGTGRPADQSHMARPSGTVRG